MPGEHSSPGRVAKPDLATQQHRGTPQYTREQMKALHPIIHVPGTPTTERARVPHDYRNSLTNTDFKGLCNLDSLPLNHPIHHP